MMNSFPLLSSFSLDLRFWMNAFTAWKLVQLHWTFGRFYCSCLEFHCPPQPCVSIFELKVNKSFFYRHSCLYQFPIDNKLTTFHFVVDKAEFNRRATQCMGKNASIRNSKWNCHRKPPPIKKFNNRKNNSWCFNALWGGNGISIFIDKARFYMCVCVCVLME